MKDDGGAELGAELGQRLLHDIARLGAVVVAAVRGDVEAGRQETGQLLPAEVGNCQVDADAAEPGAGRRGRRVAVAGPVGANECLLGQVLGGRRIEHDGADRAIDRDVLLVVKLSELGLRIELSALGHAG